MLSEIGSNFWINPDRVLVDNPLGTPELFNCKGRDYVWLSTGRSAIRLVIDLIEARNPGIKKVAVLPSFTCETVFEPFLETGYKVYYYPIEKDLYTSSQAILETALKYEASIVLFHRFFGFDTLDGEVDRMCEVLRDMGKYSIEDCTQCLYSDIERADSDFTVGSMRKWLGIPDGGFAVCRDGHFSNKPKRIDKILVEAKVKASYLKYRYLFEHKGDKDEFLAMYRKAESYLDNQEQIYRISKISSMIQANLDVRELVMNRRKNYVLLSNSLKEFVTPLFLLKKRQVPLYFPIFVDNRVALQRHLISKAIYAPIVWPKNVKQPRQCDGAENAYSHLLCLPIDQRYRKGDMERIVDVINEFYMP